MNLFAVGKRDAKTGIRLPNLDAHILTGQVLGLILNASST
jgi:hypothetical protein